jgi:hypothetical protein
MCLPEESRHSLTPDRSLCCILNRMWQVSGDRGAINPPKAIQEILEYMDIGFTLWESADRYGSAEDCIEEFRPQWEVVRGHRTLFQVLKESATKYQVSIAAVVVYSS